MRDTFGAYRNQVEAVGTGADHDFANTISCLTERTSLERKAMSDLWEADGLQTAILGDYSRKVPVPST